MLYYVFNVLMTFSLRSWYFWTMNFVAYFKNVTSFLPIS